MRKAKKLQIGLIVFAMICGTWTLGGLACGSRGNTEGAEPPITTRTVMYCVDGSEGEGNFLEITYIDAAGELIYAYDAVLGWEREIVMRDGDDVALWAHHGAAGGSLWVSIYIDGVLMNMGEAYGDYCEAVVTDTVKECEPWY